MQSREPETGHRGTRLSLVARSISYSLPPRTSRPADHLVRERQQTAFSSCSLGVIPVRYRTSISESLRIVGRELMRAVRFAPPHPQRAQPSTGRRLPSISRPRIERWTPIVGSPNVTDTPRPPEVRSYPHDRRIIRTGHDPPPMSVIRRIAGSPVASIGPAFGVSDAHRCSGFNGFRGRSRSGR